MAKKRRYNDESKGVEFGLMNSEEQGSIPLSEMHNALFKGLNQNEQQKVDAAVQSGLIAVEKDGWYFGRVKIDRVGLVVPEDVTEEEYAEVGHFLLDVMSRIQWLIGDWLAFGDDYKYNETYARVAGDFGYEVKTLYDYAYVARNVDFSVRTEKLSFTHHKLVAPLEREYQEAILQLAIDKKMSAKELRLQMRKYLCEQGLEEYCDEMNPKTPSEQVTKFIGQYTKKSWKKLPKTERTKIITALRQKLDELEQWQSNDME